MIFIEFQFNLPLKHGRPLLFSVLLLTILTIRGHQIGLKPLIAKTKTHVKTKNGGFADPKFSGTQQPQKA